MRSDDLDFTEGRIYVCDADCNDDLKKVLKAVAKTGKKVLYIGTAGPVSYTHLDVYKRQPMYYIKNGLGKNWQFLAVLFSAFGVLTVFGTGNATQVNRCV